MPYSDQITRIDDGIEGAWLVELEANGVPMSEFMFTPVKDMPDVGPA